MEQIMDTIIKTTQAILDEISALDDSILLYGGLGLVLVLLGFLFLVRKRQRGKSEDGEVEFLEVGPEPVIVYRKDEDKPENSKSEPPSAKLEIAASAPTKNSKPEPEPEPETEPQQESKAARIDLEPKPPVLDPEPDPEPEPEPDKPQVQPEAKPASKIKTKLEKNAKQKPLPSAESSDFPADPLPFLVSDLANDTLVFFSNQGLRIEEIVYQGQFGADYIATRPGLRAYVQVKDRKKKITDHALQEVYNYARSHSCNQAIIITASGFSGSIARAAAKMNIILWDYKIYKRMKKKPPALGGNTAAAKS